MHATTEPETRAGETRVYPSCCTSSYCGRTDCSGCRNLPTLEEFKAWRAARAAIRTDETWCPTVWTATR
jgi:hypothetical protein